MTAQDAAAGRSETKGSPHCGELRTRTREDYEPQRGRRPILGYVGLQNHSDNDIVFFKEVAIKPLKK